MGLVATLQTKPDLIKFVGDGKPDKSVSDTLVLLLFGVALAWRDASGLSGEGTDVYLAIRAILASVRSQLSEFRERGVIIDTRLVGVYALFRSLSDSFHL